MLKDDSYWWYVTIKSKDALEDNLFSIADVSGSIGTELRESADGVLRLRMYYASGKDLSFWRSKLLGALEMFSGAEIEDSGKIEKRAWNVAAQEAFPPLPVGENLVVLAPWHRGKEPAGRVPLYINPGCAFGTGYHESTQIALELIEKYIRPGYVTADIGTGSGILTVAALKLGASFSYARDVDPAVIEEVRKNFELNGVGAGKTDLSEGNLLKGFGKKADLLSANILLEPLVSMLKDVPAVIEPCGVAVFSGLLEKEAEIFLKAMSENGLTPVETVTKGEWYGVASSVKA